MDTEKLFAGAQALFAPLLLYLELGCRYQLGSDKAQLFTFHVAGASFPVCGIQLAEGLSRCISGVLCTSIFIIYHTF